jgi:hypothetical protein
MATSVMDPHANPRVELAAEGIRAIINNRILSIGDFLEALDLAISRHYRVDLEHLVRVEELRLIREVHQKLIETRGVSLPHTEEAR